MRLRVGLLLPLVMAGCLGAAPVGSGGTGAATAAAGDVMSPEAEAVLKGLQARAGTLKNFTAGVEITTAHPAGDSDERSGTAVYVQGAAGAGGAPGTPTKFSAHFTKSTTGTTPDDEIIFDGTKVTMVDHRAKTYRTTVLTGTGGGAGGVTSLDGPMPLPIGLDPAEVAKKFIVTVAKQDGDSAELNLKPRVRGDFDYRNLAVTVDKKLGLPVQVVMNQKSGDVMTIKLTDVKVDGAEAEVVAPPEPKEPGWVVEEK